MSFFSGVASRVSLSVRIVDLFRVAGCKPASGALLGSLGAVFWVWASACTVHGACCPHPPKVSYLGSVRLFVL
jgi:hypothetical protein